MEHKKRKLKKKWIYSLIVITIIIIFIIVIFNKGNITYKINGLSTEIVNVKTNYIDNGVIVYRNGKKLNEKFYTLETENNIDTTKLGIYKIKYKIKYRNDEYNLTRTVEVKDIEEPKIDTNIELLERDYCSDKAIIELKYSVLDNYDGDITEDVNVSEEGNYLILIATDKNGNTAEKRIPITYINKPTSPEKITIKGPANIYTTLNGSYKELGATITSECGNNSNRVIISNTVDNTKIGEYEIKYSIKNNDSIYTIRKVIVYEPNISSNQNKNNEKTIYLTFDDGPCAYTKKVLETLNKYNVKSTFFVTNQFPSYVSLIKDEYDAGHAIGVHTYNHNYNIYSSIETYINDFNKMNNIIEKYTGQKSQIFRFPGGSSNTVSANYSIGIMKALATKMSSEGYAYFDWDVSSGDASGASSERIYNNIVNGVKSCSRCVVLMHDIKYNTVNILDNVLEELTSNGYKFGTLSLESPTCHHGIAN